MQVELKASILKVLVYFDLFNYPVSKEEIYIFLDSKCAKEDLTADLNTLMHTGYIFKFNEFYTLKNDPGLIKKRLKENNYAQSLLITARKISKFLFAFPYVKGIGISGSLSKNVADENADIDYFIITSANRLWIARTIMHLFKKFTFITGHQHWYCMNYYVDEEGMQIEEKNIFTATELVTLLPICGTGTMEKFFICNDWAKKYFPNYNTGSSILPHKTSPSKIKKTIELLFNNRLGDWLDGYLMKLTANRWARKEKKQKLNSKGNLMGLKAGRHYCKPSPSFFHERILTRYATRLKEIEGEWMLSKQLAN